MTNTINDYVFELQWNGSKVKTGLDDLEKRLKNLKQTGGSKTSSPSHQAKAYEKSRLDSIKSEASATKEHINRKREENAALKKLSAQRLQEMAFETKRIKAINDIAEKNRKVDRFSAATSNITGKQGDVIRGGVASAKDNLVGFNKKWGQAGAIKSKESLAKMQQDLARVNGLTKNLSSNLDVASKKFSAMRNITKRIGATFLAMGASTMGAYALAGGVQASFAAAKEYEKLDIAMTAAFGSQQAANREMLYAEDVAKRYALDIMAVGEGWSKISYAAKMSNMPIDQARQMFEDLAVSSRAFGLSADDTKGAMRAVIQMMGKGKVNAEDLRQQLAERIPAAIPMLAKSMGITISELEDQMKAGAIPAEKLVGMFRLMAEDVKGSGALNKSLKSLSAAQTALSNASKRASKAFWGENAKGGFKDFMFMLTDFLDGNTKAIGQWGDTFAIAGRIVLDTLGAISPIISIVNTGFQSLFGLFENSSTSMTQFGTLNTLGKVLAFISWGIRDIKMAYEDLQKLLNGGEIVGGQNSIEASRNRAMKRGVSLEDQIAWEAKYGNDLSIVEDRLKNNQLSYKTGFLEGEDSRSKHKWMAAQAEKLNAMRSSLGGQDPYSYGTQSGSLSNMMRIGEKMTTNLIQGKLEFKVDASNVINLNKDGIADVSIPYGFQLGFNDSGGKNRGN